ncbi:MFS transporter [Bacillus sp. FJAT-45350]|uniref:MFS transporter n=1 Tax=Bacillus sp. FJAT-45350 TaxID=2011014 RepID=UPI000BB7FA2F|nr:MFS transporter [Bacillus sp. FJAT-45350]
MNDFVRSFYSKTSMYAFFVVLVLIFTMWVGTKGFVKIDMMLFGYFISSIVFAIGITVRTCSWLIRPATHQVFKRTLQNLKKRKRQKRNVKAITKTLVDNIILQKFIFKRGLYRGIQHWLVAWGCIGSFGFTFGLTFGWIHFALIDAQTYAVVAMGVQVMTMHPDGFIAHIMYNILNITALMVLGGVTMMMIRRARDKNVQVGQRFEFDLFPLYVLLAVTVTGLLLTVSYKFLGGFIHPYLSLIHQITVVIFLVYFPFGKLFHLPIRPLAVSVPMNYQEVIQVDTRACKKCGTNYSSDDQIEDVKGILGVQNFDLQLEDGSYLADYCPSCRRRMRVMSQLNLENPMGNPFGPIQTNNGIHVPGFSQKRSEEFYNKSESKEEK